MLSSLIPSKFLAASMHHARDRPPQGAQPSDALSHLRFVLETMPGSRKYVFTPATRAEILAELYDAFWGPNAALFLPGASATLPSNQTLHQAQVASGFSGTGISDPPYPGKVCSRTIVRGESCFRCRQVLFSSCRIVLHRLQGLRPRRELRHVLAMFLRHRPYEPQRQFLHCPAVRGMLRLR